MSSRYRALYSVTRGTRPGRSRSGDWSCPGCARGRVGSTKSFWSGCPCQRTAQQSSHLRLGRRLQEGRGRCAGCTGLGGVS